MRRFVLFLSSLCFMIACNGNFSEQENAVLPEDYAALESLYNTLGGENWNNNTNWCSDKPLEEWYGVYTHLGRVVAIDLSNNNLVGTLPSELASLTQLKSLNLAINRITGSIPESYSTMPNLTHLSLYNNSLSGEIPSSLNNLDGWRYNWGYAVRGNRYNRFNLYDCGITAPDFDLTLLSGERLRVDSEFYAANNYTLLFQWSQDKHGFVNTLKPLYDKYNPFGLEVVSWCAEAPNVASLVKSYGVEWSVATVSEQMPLCQYSTTYYPVGVTPTVTMFDSQGKLVFSDVVESRGNIVSVVEKLFADIINPDLYYSTDFSADGKVVKMQCAEEGAGIDVVLMGDGFSDRMIADGTYLYNMQQTANALFALEPMRSFSHLFNLYGVNVVSPNEVIASNATTALKCRFGEGTTVVGDNEKCVEYAQKAVGDKSLDDVLIVVVVNSDRYAGTTYNYYPTEAGDFGSGAAIAYLPLVSDSRMFEGLLCHEAVGHGFAKLDDEYVLEGMGRMPVDEVTYREQREAFGWYKNTDIYSSVHFVKWKELLKDRRYTAAGLGVFEGASTYAYGVYRPTDQSVMNKNEGGFNAPSRESIYYRIHKLAYGKEWHYSVDVFKEYDYINFIGATACVVENGIDNQSITPLSAPVVCSEPLR